jgi:RNA polymerase sigma factor
MSGGAWRWDSMLWIRKRKTKEIPKDELIDILKKIQQGDSFLRDELIKEYSPFIIKTVSDVCKRYISESDDEFSVGLLAFNDAIDKFDTDKGQGFIAFAKVVITNRIIDYKRAERNQFIETTLDPKTQEIEITKAEVNSSLQQYQEEQLANFLAEEIALYSKKLEEYGISFEELAEISPKHYDARKSAMEVAKLIVEDEELREALLTKKRLPLKQILTKVSISKPTLERNRKYIIAVAVLLESNFTYLKQFLSIEGGTNINE